VAQDDYRTIDHTKTPNLYGLGFLHGGVLLVKYKSTIKCTFGK